MRHNFAFALLAIGASTAVASADTLVTFAYNNLAGTYTPTNATSGSFGAIAVDSVGLQTIGDVTRLTVPSGTADFNSGFVSAPNPANFVVNVSVDAIDQILGLALGTGSFTITDNDGSTITGAIDGVWIRGGLGQTFFNGNLTNVNFTGASFDGDSGSFSTNFGSIANLEGAFTQLLLNPGTGGFFTAGFQGVATQAQGEIIPTPGAIALLGIGGLMAARRRR